MDPMATTSQFFGGPETADFFSTVPPDLTPTQGQGPVGSPVLMILEGGPLDGEEQMVEMVPTTIGAQLRFNMPNFQTFDPTTDTEVVTGLGLQAIYALVARGRDPGPADNWDSSWIFTFTGEAFVPVPDPLPQPGPSQPVAMAQVWMSATTTLVPDTLPITSDPVVNLDGESTMSIDAVVTPVQNGLIVMTGETSMSVTPDWEPHVRMEGDSTMQMFPVVVLKYHELVLESNPFAYWPLTDAVGSTSVAELVTGDNGLVQGGVIFGVPDPWGFPEAARFDGTTGYVVDSVRRANQPQVFTVECWYRTTDATGAMVEFNTAQVVAGTYTPDLYMLGSKLSGRMFGAGGSHILSDPNTSVDGNWHHGAFTVDSTTLLSIYRDGQLVISGQQSGLQQVFSGFWHIGNGQVNGFVAADIAHVAVYSRVLSAAEILSHATYLPS